MLRILDKVLSTFGDNTAIYVHKDVYKNSKLRALINDYFLEDASNNYYALSYRSFGILLHSVFISYYLNRKDTDTILCIDSDNVFDSVLLVCIAWYSRLIPAPINHSLVYEEKLDILRRLRSELFHTTDGRFSSTAKITIRDHEIQPEEYQPSDSTAVVLFTSGTGGHSKGVQLTFDNLLASYRLQSSVLEYNQFDNWLLSLPIHHIGGCSIFIRAFLSGASLTIPKSRSTNDLIAALYQKKNTRISLVPTQLKRLISNDIVSPKWLRNIFVGGAPTDASLLNQAAQKGFPVTKVYGATETTAFVTCLKDSSDFTSVGKPLPEVEIKIYDHEKAEVIEDGYGEIMIKSPTIMKQYLFNDRLTDLVLKDSYYYSGDYGYVDSAGNLILECRKDNLIISGGENISPSEIEHILNKLDSVEDVAVFGVPDAVWGQKVVAALVIKKGVYFNKDKYASFEKNKFAPHKSPKEILLINEIPINDLGKVDRPKLLDLYLHREDYNIQWYIKK